MNSYLVFQLYGAMASWGEVAIGETRPSTSSPSRSAVIGMIAAALGIRRNEQNALEVLSSTIGYAVCVEKGGELMRDYHTTQVPPTKRKQRFYTRQDELASDKIGTILSTREYRCDAYYQIALWLKSTDNNYSLEQIRSALERPRFTLYLGRKSAPLGLPLKPVLVQADSLLESFKYAREQRQDSIKQFAGLVFDRGRLYLWEECDCAGMEPESVSVRRDNPLNRTRWQFGNRKEYYYFERKDVKGG